MNTKNKDPDFSKEVFKYDMKINKLNRSKIKNQTSQAFEILTYKNI